MTNSKENIGRLFVLGQTCSVVPTLIAWLVTLAVLVSGYAPLLLAPLIFLFGLALIGFVACRGSMVGALKLPDGLTVALLSFGLWGALSSLWAMKPSVAIEKATLFLALVCFVYLFHLVMPSLSNDTMRRMARGILTGFVIALLFPLFEYATDFAFLNTVASYFPNAIGRLEAGRVADFYLNRQVNVLALFAWPVALLVPVFWRGQRHHQLVYGGAVAAALLLILVPTASQTAQASFVVSGLVFLVAKFVPRVIDSLARALWVIAVIGIILIVMGLHALGVQDWQQVPFSFRDRIAIWHYTTERIGERPLTGVGIRSQRYMHVPSEDRNKFVNGALQDHLGHHNHNAFLEIWYQLGTVGALLLLPIGLLLLSRVRALPPPIQPYAQAAFASVCIVAAVGYGFWQSWLLAAYAWLAILMLIAADYTARTEVEPLRERD